MAVQKLSIFTVYTCSMFSFVTLAADKEASLVHDEVPLEENVNRLVTEGEEARNVEDAIAMMR